MTETQATSGAAGTSTNPVDKETEGSPPGGRAAVGRATVPATESGNPKSAPQNAGASSEGSPAGSSGAGGEGSGARQPEGRRPEESSGQPTEPAPSVRPSVGAPGGLAGSGAPMAGGVKYTRAPGMAAPPDVPPTGDGRSADPERPSATPAVATGTATVPMRIAGVTLPPVPGAPSLPITGRPGGLATGRPTLGALPSGRSVGAARVAAAVRGARSTSSAAAARGPRRARLVLKRVDPWSVMKFSFAVSLVLFIVTVVATSVLYLALDAMGVFDSVNASLGDLLTSAASSESEGGGFKITAGGVIGTSALLGLINVVLVTALATLGAFIYNVCADLVGGVEMTLSERE